jgi:hypothetical protein
MPHFAAAWDMPNLAEILWPERHSRSLKSFPADEPQMNAACSATNWLHLIPQHSENG